MSDDMDMGAKPKRTRAKNVTREELEAMFARQEEHIDKYIDERCESCSHHECECPERIKDLDRSTERRMDIIDQNVETVQSNLEKTYDVLAQENEELRARMDEQDKDVRRLTKENDRTYRSMEGFAMIAGVAGVLCMVIVGLAIAGYI